MRKIAVVATAILVIVLAGIGVLVRSRVQNTLSQTRSQLAREGNLAFERTTISHIENPGFKALTTPSSYRTAVVFGDKLYLAGPGGLAELSTPEGNPRLWRTGLDLPPAPIVRMATGVLRGVGHPELMLATRGEGVLFYDGSSLRQLRPQLAAARDITAILPLSSGDLLLGTRQLGLLVYDGKTLSSFHASLGSLDITALAGDSSDLWIGTRNRGVFHWHAGQLDDFDATSGLPDQQVECLASSAGRVFVGTPLGVAEFVDGRPGRILAPGLFAHSLAVDGGVLTIASIDQGIHEVPIDAGGNPHASHAPALDLEEASDLVVVSRIGGGDALLAVTPSGLLRRQRSGQWQPIFTSEPSMLADSNISALSFDPDGRLWIGYFDRGLDIVTSPGAGDTSARHIEDDHIFCVNRILPDPRRNTVDVATANGLVLFDAKGHPRQTLLRRDGLIADQVNDIALTRDGLALATPAGVTLIDATGLHSLYAFHGLVNNHVYTLATDSGGSRLLAGTLGGLTMLHNGAVNANLTSANSGLKQNWTTAIVPVSDSTGDRFFIGTYGSGVMQLDDAGHITPMEGGTRPSVVNPNAMLVTARQVYAGTLGDGLLVYNRATLRWSRVVAGLPSLNVTALVEHDGELYIGTENGIVEIAESRLVQ
jgi:ligand-binding sensor domain-containing protein